MHIEPGVVEGAKMLLSYGTAAAAVGVTLQTTLTALRENNLLSLVSRTVLATLAVFLFFEVFWHHPVGVSEVHLILGTTLYLLFGLVPTAIGLAGGLFIQGFFFAPADLPQYAMNTTTLLAPLFVMHLLAKKIIPANTAYVDLTYAQTFKLSAAYQGGIITWVAFWAFYGQGFGAENLANVTSFAIAYSGVVLVEPLIDLAILYTAKSLRHSAVFEKRLYEACAA
ncbi:MAG: energy-coupling factor ABC transporter permease [Rhodocyclaceae bacterium]|nr:energy-coupling factor ABC transporter permease [Rhodocyclaceae bacterium]